MKIFIIATCFFCTGASFAAKPKPSITRTWAVFSSQPIPRVSNIASLIEHYRNSHTTQLFFRVPYGMPGLTSIFYTPTRDARFFFSDSRELVRFFVLNPPPGNPIIHRPFEHVATLNEQSGTLREYIGNITRVDPHLRDEQAGLTGIIERLLPEISSEQALRITANYQDLLELFHRNDVLVEHYPRGYARQHMLNVFRAELIRLRILEPTPAAAPTRTAIRVAGFGSRTH